MMNQKHTPGPWQVSATDDTVVYSNGRQVALCQEKTPFQSEENKANAKLISAAPDLLLTLKALVNSCKFIPKEVFTEEGQKDFQFILTSASTAIQKATTHE